MSVNAGYLIAADLAVVAQIRCSSVRNNSTVTKEEEQMMSFTFFADSENKTPLFPMIPTG